MNLGRIRKSQVVGDDSTASTNSFTENKSNVLTIKELKSFPGFENIEDKEAEEIIQSLYKLSILKDEVLNRGYVVTNTYLCLKWRVNFF